ncbi:hypothetical protein [Winogradskyella sp.]|uniref:hypothetical protein n=1 Tax=Winogradskyella sp. TaxID=1883156 RepID=UPI0026320112|nr:hypothetical protein [Winogradskyella sp.]
MKLIITLLAFSFFNLSLSQVTLKDEGLHFATGAVISAGTYALVYSTTKNKKKAFWYSLGISTLAGLSKEIHDGFIIDGKFDTGEFVATALGGLTASYTFNIFTGKQKKKKREKELEATKQRA